MNTSLRRRTALLAPAAALGLALPLALPSVANAAAASVVRYGSTVVYNAANGSANVLTVSVSGGVFVVTDTSGLFAGPGCTAVSATTATCGTGVTQFAASTRDGDDTINLNAAIPSVIDAGSGNDTINARNGAPDRISCGDGSDTVRADSFDLVAADCEVVTH